ncbi:hypothetical protein L2E82_30234 [Cichorium intybus]|uniref:Uncharacterized protein n=1 Tax=Cichorium intybus TaxID=13427 RepID=A0ACB9CZQ3_CICIN|nr:hypothetical protein L2E82_30234 [Cichorium intybus]
MYDESAPPPLIRKEHSFAKWVIYIYTFITLTLILFFSPNRPASHIFFCRQLLPTITDLHLPPPQQMMNRLLRLHLHQIVSPPPPPPTDPVKTTVYHTPTPPLLPIPSRPPAPLPTHHRWFSDQSLRQAV